MVVTEEGKYLFVHKVVSESTQKKTSHAANSKMLVNIFSHALQNIWRMINTIASILFELSVLIFGLNSGYWLYLIWQLYMWIICVDNDEWKIFLVVYPGVSSVVLQKQIKDLHQEQKVLRDTGLVKLLPILFSLCFLWPLLTYIGVHLFHLFHFTSCCFSDQWKLQTTGTLSVEQLAVEQKFRGICMLLLFLQFTDSTWNSADTKQNIALCHLR